MFKILYCLSVVLAESFVIIAVLFLFVNNFFTFFKVFYFKTFTLSCNLICRLELLYLTILCNFCQLLFLLFYFSKFVVLTFCNCYILSLLLFFVNSFFYFLHFLFAAVIVSSTQNSYASVCTNFFCFADGLKWTRTTDLTLIRRAL